MDKSADSEFGKGLVICLVKFAEHVMYWHSQKQHYQQIRESQDTSKRMLNKLDGYELFSESDAVKIWFNGASDHLYEIEVPESWKSTPIGKKVKELKDFGLLVGHGYLNDKKYSEADVIKASNLCREIALLVDKKIGLNPDIGKW